MNQTDYPHTFQSADSASLAGQAWYKSLVRFDLLISGFGAACGGISTFIPEKFQTPVIGISILCLVVGFISKLVAMAVQYDKGWFDGRAVAESAKSATWRYMMHIPPFNTVDSDSILIQRLKAIRRVRPDVPINTGLLLTDSTQITTTMSNVHNMPFLQRKEFYLANRLDDQRIWYAKKARYSEKMTQLLFWITILCQFAAIALSIARITGGKETLQFVTMAILFSASATAWFQVSRHDELRRSYALAAEELLEIRELMLNHKLESEFESDVESSEEAISREHTLWIAKRTEPFREITV